MNLGAALSTSFLVTLVRPATWLLALLAFLVRGGLVIVLAPIVVIPSAAGLATTISPLLTSLVFGGLSAGLVALILGLILVGLAWLVAGGLVAAVAEAEQIDIVAADEEVLGGGYPGSPRPGGARLDRAARILGARLIALIPTLLALAWGSVRIVTTTYRELTVPSDVTLPIPVRVIAAAPDAVVVLLVAWLAGEIVGAIAVRRIVLGDGGLVSGLGQGLRYAVRHPLRVLVLELVPLAALIAVAVPSAAAAATAWAAIGGSFRSDAGPVQTITLVILFVVLWTGGLLLIGVMSAWRTAAWTVALARTFGATQGDPPGEWKPTAESGTLTDLRPRGVDPDTR